MDNKPLPLLYLSNYRVLYIGKLQCPLKVASASAGIIVSLGGDIDFFDHESYTGMKAKSFLVPVNKKVTIDPGSNVVAICLLDYLGQDFKTIVPQMQFPVGDDVYCKHKRELSSVDLFKSIYEESVSAEVAFKRLDDFFVDEAIVVSDERVKKAIELILSNTDLDLSVDVIARHVSLSVPRLTQLFRQVTGINIRRFKIWHRVYTTALLCAEGLNLTNAAITAGFSDYAHFSRLFTEMTGIRPSYLFSSKYNVRIQVLSSSRIKLNESIYS